MAPQGGEWQEARDSPYSHSPPKKRAFIMYLYIHIKGDQLLTCFTLPSMGAEQSVRDQCIHMALKMVSSRKRHAHSHEQCRRGKYVPTLQSYVLLWSCSGLLPTSQLLSQSGNESALACGLNICVCGSCWICDRVHAVEWVPPC